MSSSSYSTSWNGALRFFLPDGDGPFGVALRGDCVAVLAVERGIDLGDEAKLFPSWAAVGSVFGFVFFSLPTFNDAADELLDAFGDGLGDAFKDLFSLLLVVVPALEGLFFLEDGEEAADFAMLMSFVVPVCCSVIVAASTCGIPRWFLRSQLCARYSSPKSGTTM
jgi:hypothetical protein